MGTRIGLVVDCREPERLATFWSDAPGYEVLGAAGSYVLLRPSGGDPGPQLLMPDPEGNEFCVCDGGGSG